MSKPRKGRLRHMLRFKKGPERQKDSGMTLPELLVSVTLTAILATSLGGSHDRWPPHSPITRSGAKDGKP